MDLRGFYKKIVEVSTVIEETFPIVASLATPDGGKSGVLTEVSRALAAKMLVEGIVRLATKAEAAAFKGAQAAAKALVDQTALANMMQVAVLTAADMDKLRQPAGQAAASQKSASKTPAASGAPAR